MGCRLWGRTELDTTEVTQQQQQHVGVGSWLHIFRVSSQSPGRNQILYCRVLLSEFCFQFSLFRGQSFSDILLPSLAVSTRNQHVSRFPRLVPQNEFSLSRSLSNASKEMILHCIQHVQVFYSLNIFLLVFHTVRNRNYFLSFFFFGVQLLYNVLVSAVEQNESAIHIHTVPLLGICLPFSSSQSTEWSSLCHTVVSYWLSVLYIAVYVYVNLYLPIHPAPSLLSLMFKNWFSMSVSLFLLCK